MNVPCPRGCGQTVQKAGAVLFNLHRNGPLTHQCQPQQELPMTAASPWDEFTADPNDFRRVPPGEKGAGTPLIVPPGGDKPKRYRRATTYIGAVEDDYGIAQWRRHLTVDGLLGDSDGPSTWPSLDWQGRIDACDGWFLAAGGTDKADAGTRMHSLTDYIDRGDPLPPGTTSAEMADLEAYRQAVKPLEPVHIECKLVHDDLEVAGTADRVWRYKGRNYIGDLKTGKIDGRKCAMQTALYSRSRLYDLATGDRTDLDVDQDRALIVHLPYGEAKARVLWVDIARGWDGVLLCADVYAWRRQQGLVDGFAHFDPLRELIDRATTAEALGALWREHRSEWTDDHTAAAATRKQALAGVAA